MAKRKNPAANGESGEKSAHAEAKESLRACMESNANSGKGIVKVSKKLLDGFTKKFEDEEVDENGYVTVEARKVAAALA